MGLVTDENSLLCPRCGRRKHFPDASCSMNWIGEAGHTKVEPAQQIRGTGCCQVCQRADQDLYIVRVPGGQNRPRARKPGDPEDHRMSETAMYLCKGCGHALCMQLLEFLCL